MNFLILIFAAVVFETIADILFKMSYIQNKSLLLWSGVGLYTIGTIIWAFSLKHEHISKAITLFSVLNLIAIVCVGVLFFNEDLSLVNKIGVGLGVLSVILLQM